MENPMPNIEISTTSFSRLQAYATPLVDSVETALQKVLDLADAASSKGAGIPAGAPIKSGSVPDLSHATLTSAAINGKSLPPGQCNWNALLLAAVEEAAHHLPKGAKLSNLIVVNHVEGQKEDSGYKHLSSVGLSVQGQNSNNAWKAISHLAKATGIKVEAGFYWSNHPKAAKPGETGQLVA
jgi:hypothetical protein